MKITPALLILFFCFASCTDKSVTGEMLNPVIPQPANPSVPSNGTVSYLALGDSYTIGQSVAVDKAFPNQLAAALNKRSIAVSSPTIIAQTGWTTDLLIDAIKSAKLNPQYDFVTLLIGVNNQFRGYSKDAYRTQFAELLQTAIKYAGGKAENVFVVSIPDWGVTPFASSYNRNEIAKEINEFNLICKLETAKTKAIYTDITGISREASVDNGYIAVDGLHPSGVMYAEWVKLLEPKVYNVIK